MQHHVKVVALIYKYLNGFIDGGHEQYMETYTQAEHHLVELSKMCRVFFWVFEHVVTYIRDRTKVHIHEDSLKFIVLVVFNVSMFGVQSYVIGRTFPFVKSSLYLKKYKNVLLHRLLKYVCIHIWMYVYI